MTSSLDALREPRARPAGLPRLPLQAALLMGALGGASKEELLCGVFEPVPDRWVREPIAPPIIEVAAGSFRRRNPPYVRGTGYVVRSLEGGAACRQPGRGCRYDRRHLPSARGRIYGEAGIPGGAPPGGGASNHLGTAERLCALAPQWPVGPGLDVRVRVLIETNQGAGNDCCRAARCGRDPRRFFMAPPRTRHHSELQRPLDWSTVATALGTPRRQWRMPLNRLAPPLGNC
jgi:hypothetical protein